MTWQANFTLFVLIVTVVLLALERIPPAMTVLTATIVLLVAGVVTPAEAFSGFSNPAPLTVAALYVLARAVEQTGGLQPMVSAALGRGNGVRSSLLRILLPTATISAFVNNTPIVAMLVPQITEWADRNGRSPSNFLMPISFAAILGGVTTAIGTSTNLVVSGLLQARHQPAIGMFEITKAGLPLALVGIVAVVLIAPLVLPERRPPRRILQESEREFVVSTAVSKGGALDGRTVEAGGLRHLQGVYLVEIERGDDLIAPVSPATVLRGGDRLTFVGNADLVMDLRVQRGLELAEEHHLARLDASRHTFFEVVVGADSPLLGQTLRESQFRGTYQAAVVAIHRAGQQVKTKLGEVSLRLADTLLLLSDPGFRDRWRHRNDFLVISTLGAAAPPVSRKAWVVGLIAAAIVLCPSLGVLPILQASLLGALVLVLLNVLTPGEAVASLDMNVIMVIAAAFGLGAAMETSGLADDLALMLTTTSATLGPRAALLGVVLATVTLTEIITNNAAAVLMFPIAMTTAARLHLATRPFAMAIALAASASFLTPVGYQTNTMVYGPGGYRFGDYARLGGLLTAVVITLTTVIVPLWWPVH